MIAGIILAAGKGSRFKARGKNKVAIEFHGSSPIQRAVRTMSDVVNDIYVVVGHESESVKAQLADYNVHFVTQHEQKGTGHAFQVALDAMDISLYENVIVGNGDHMMFYTPESLQEVLDKHQSHAAVATCVTSAHPDVHSFGFGRILRDEKGNFRGIVEQRDATPKQQAISEFNAGLYMFDTAYACEALHKVSTNNAAGEMYVIDVCNVALDEGKTVIAIPLAFEYVGIGINSREDYERALALFESNTVT